MGNGEREGAGGHLDALVMVIGDDLLGAKVWAYSLQQLGLETCLAELNNEGMALFQSEMPDLVLVDSHAPNPELQAIFHQLREASPAPVIAILGQSDEQMVLDVYRAGVDDCLVRPVSLAILLAKVQVWLRRGREKPSLTLEAVQVGDFCLDPRRRRLTLPGGSQWKLTYLEARLMHTLLAHPGHIVETDSLVESIWGRYGHGDSSLLKNLVYRLRQKVEPRPSQPRYILTEPNVGYRLSVTGG